MADSHIPFPVPPDNSVESLRIAFQQLAQSTEKHVGTVTSTTTSSVSGSAASSAGSAGVQGTKGTAATIEVGTVTTGLPGTSAAVSNSGTDYAAVFDFTIPQGFTGATGTTGATGPEGPMGPSGGSSPLVTLGATFATNQAFRLVSGIAQPIYSTDTDAPWVDGLVLESGITGTTSVAAAMVDGMLYPTPLALPTGSPLFLGQDGKPTATEPSSLAGDVWSVATVRQVDAMDFIFSPTIPIKLA